MTNIIHHYTDINTLALILKNKTIRFNRLNRVDDVSESNAFDKLNLGEFFFVSSWTYEDRESIPQWNMYTTDMAGVRISMPKNLFEYEPLQVPEDRSFKQNGTVYSPIPFDKMFTKDYMIFPHCINEDQFIREVQYEDNYKELKNNAINVTVDKNKGDFHANIEDPARIASLKSPEWSFQKELRFVLLIFPAWPVEPLTPQYWEKLPDLAANSLYQGEGPELNYIDIELSELALEDMEITLGPLCKEGDYVLVESLLSKYAPEGNLRKSQFTGTIRKS